MFDGTVPVNLERLKEIYRAFDRMTTNLAALIQVAHNEGLPTSFQEGIQALEVETDEIRALFQGVLTSDEQEELVS